MYAGKWVVVRGGKVVLEAPSRDALMTILTSVRTKRTTDVIVHLPPM